MTPDSPNVVRLHGRLSTAPAVRTLPSGDEIVFFRVVVERSPASLRRSKVKVDSFECTVWSAALREYAVELQVGAQVMIEGELRSRFSRSTHGVLVRVTVDVASIHPAVASSS